MRFAIELLLFLIVAGGGVLAFRLIGDWLDERAKRKEKKYEGNNRSRNNRPGVDSLDRNQSDR